MSEIPVEASQALYQQIRTVLVTARARARAWQSVNAEMVACYWEIGRLIDEEEQRGKARAEYGRQLILALAKRLAVDFGRGFGKSNLWNMRSFYEVEAAKARWSTRELERQVNSLLFERLALSHDKSGVMELAARGHEVQQPLDLVKDPYVLEFTGLRQDERFLEKDLEGALIGRRLCAIPCRRGISRSLRRVTNSTSRPRRNWQRNCGGKRRRSSGRRGWIGRGHRRVTDD